MRAVEAEGVRWPVVGLGTWQFGSAEWGYGDEYARVEAGAIVERALELGIRLVDTAEIYGMGRSERIVGAAVRGRRDEVLLATKLFPVLPVAPVVAWRARRSAARLGVEVIDLYQVHWPNPAVPLGVTMDGLRRLLRSGLVRHVGVSNFSLARWLAAERALGSPVLSNQVRFNLVDRGPAEELVPHAAAHGRLVIAYSPLAQGLLGGTYGPGRPPSGAARRANPLFSTENLKRAGELLAVLREVARDVGATPAQVALAWVIRHPNVVVIPGARHRAQLEANAEAASLQLSDAQAAMLRQAAVAFRPRVGRLGLLAGGGGGRHT